LRGLGYPLAISRLFMSFFTFHTAIFLSARDSELIFDAVTGDDDAYCRKRKCDKQLESVTSYFEKFRLPPFLYIYVNIL